MLFADVTQTDTITEKLDAISRCLLQHEGKIESPALLYGRSGILLFYAMYHKLTGEHWYIDKLESGIHETVTRINNGYDSPSISNELMDFGSFLEFLSHEDFLCIDTNSLLNHIDILAERQMQYHLEHKNYDSATGALKAGYYFIRRLNSNPNITGYLSTLAEEIGKLAFYDEHGHSFWKSKLKNDDRVYLTMPHGLADIIIFLSALYNRNISASLCYSLINSAVPFLKERKYPVAQLHSFYPNINGEVPDNTRLALYYGDMGIIYALEKAAKVLKSAALLTETENMWIQMAERRGFEQTGVQYAGFIYGSAGNMHIFSKKFIETGNSIFEKAANYWLDETIQYSTGVSTYAGFESIYKYNSDYTNLTVNAGLGEGIAGIGCALCNKLAGSKVSLETLLGYL